MSDGEVIREIGPGVNGRAMNICRFAVALMLLAAPLAVDAQQPARGYRSGYLGISCGIGFSGIPGGAVSECGRLRQGPQATRPATAAGGD